MPTGATTGNVVVSVNGVNSNPLSFAVVPRPQITSLSQNVGVAGTPITLKGSDFGATQGNSVVTFNGTVGTVQSWSDSVIVVSVPNGASTGNVVVTVSGLASNGQLFTIPVISNINPFDGPPGILLTIAGSGFGATRGSGTAMVGIKPITVYTWTDSQIVGAVAPGTQSGNVTVQQGSLTITGPAFTVDTSLPYTITPQSLSMVVGDSRTVSAVDSQGNAIKGLDWFATDTTIVSLSTDDPPVITALAPGSVTVYAGDVPLPINVYASTSAMPPGTPIWSVPMGGSGPMQVVPAVPSSSGADVFAMDSTGTLTALASDGSIVWKQSGTTAGSVIPDFSGSAYLKGPYSYTDSQNKVVDTHKVQYVNRTTGTLQDIYTFSDVNRSTGIATDAETQSGGFPVQTVIPHPTGPVFVQDTSTVSVIDPTGVQPTTTVTLPGEGIFGNGYSATDVGKMIVAGDGNAYVPYLYAIGDLEGNPALGSSSGSGTEYLMLLRISPDGSNASTQLGSWSSSYNCVPWTAPDNSQGYQCTNSSIPPSLGDLSVITNADQGAAVFVRRDTYGCTVTYADPLYTGGPLPNVCSGDATHNHMDIYYIAQDAVTSQITDAAIFPNDLTGPLIFVPELQREDGSYIGSDSGLDYVMAMGAGGGILWQYQTGSHSTQDVPARPLYATADGGVIFTTSQQDCPAGDISISTGNFFECQSQAALPGSPNYGQLGTIYTLDQNGNPYLDGNGNVIGQLPDFGSSLSWTGRS